MSDEKLSIEEQFLELLQKKKATTRFDVVSDIIDYLMYAQDLSNTFGLTLDVESDLNSINYFDDEYNNPIILTAHQKLRRLISKITVRYDLQQKTFEKSIHYSISVKNDLNSVLDTIEGIVNSKITDENKKTAIHKKLNALRLEINTDRTTWDRCMSKARDVLQICKEYKDEIPPLWGKGQKLIERLVGDSEDVPMLSDNKTKRIEHHTEQENSSDDDI